jgi:DNA-binding transcriptional regulator YdaS (Cro superfamily)
MKLQDYLTKHGRGAGIKLAAKIGAHGPDLYRWASGKRPVPEKFCVLIEQATDGAVGRKDLRPDDWHLIWPELIKVKKARKTKETA